MSGELKEFKYTRVVRQHVLVLGRRGTGKSTVLKHLSRDREREVSVFDDVDWDDLDEVKRREWNMDHGVVLMSAPAIDLCPVKLGSFTHIVLLQERTRERRDACFERWGKLAGCAKEAFLKHWDECADKGRALVVSRLANNDNDPRWGLSWCPASSA